MGVGYKRTLTTGSAPVFQGYGKDIQLAQGGFVLDITGLKVGDVLPAGIPMNFNEATRVAKPLILAKVYENAAAGATSIKVYKGHYLAAGMHIGAKVGQAAHDITAIDTTNAAYDALTLDVAIGALTAGDLLFQSSAAGANAAAFALTPNGLLYADTPVASGESLSVALKATVYARRVPYSADLAAALPKIIYSQSL